MSGFEPEQGSTEWHRQRANIERGSEAWEQLYGIDNPAERKWFTKKRFIIPAGVLGLLIFRIGTIPHQTSPATATNGNRPVSSAGLDSAEQPMSFGECNRHIRAMADEFGTTPSNIVDSSAMRVVRFPATDGSVLVTCDAIDEKMIVVNSPHGS